MMEKSRVAAYGSIKYAEVIGPVKREGSDEQYRDVKFLTPVPNRQEGIKRFMPFSDVAKVTGKSFFWARTIKVPYLSKDEAETLVKELKAYLEKST